MIKYKRRNKLNISRRAISLILCAVLCFSGIVISPQVSALENGDHMLRKISVSPENIVSGVTILGMQDAYASAYGSTYWAVYCIDRFNANIGEKYNTSVDKSDPLQPWWNDYYKNQIFWIVRNGYQGKLSDNSLDVGNSFSFGVTPEEAYIATQLAIWYFTEYDFYTPPSGLSSGIWDMYEYLIAEAAGADAYDPLPSYEPTIEIGFELDGAYDPVYGVIGPLYVNVVPDGEKYGVYEQDEQEYLYTDDVPVTVTALGDYMLCNSQGYSQQKTAKLKDGQPFYVYVGSDLSGLIELAEAEATIEYTAEDSGFFFWYPDSTVQPICGWGDYKISSKAFIDGKGTCAVTAFKIEGNKIVDGDPPNDKKRIFDFTLTEYTDSSYQTPVVGGESFVSTSGGDFVLVKVVGLFNQSDTSTHYYYFTIQETDESDDEWTYDSEPKKIIVKYENGVPTVEYVSVEFTNTWDGGLFGDLIIKKELGENHSDWGVTPSTEFKARIKDGNNKYILLTGTGPVYKYNGVSDMGGDLITFSSGQYATIEGLPANIEYFAEEIEESHFTVDQLNSTLSALVEDGKTADLTVINKYEHGTGDLVINKILKGGYGDWGVTSSTVFYVQISDVTDGNTLLFKSEPEANGTYRCIGNEVNGLSEAYSGTPQSKLPVSGAKPLKVSNLWAGREYKVTEEIVGGHYTAEYSGNDVMLAEGQNSTITITNDYDFEHGAGGLIISKKLAGSYAEWEVDSSTIFTAMIKDITRNNYLLFKSTPEADGSYRCVGNDVDGLSEAYYGTTIVEVPFSEEKSARLSNLWSDTEYEVEETGGGAHYTATYNGNNVAFPDGANRTVTVINTFKHQGMGNLVVNKILDGGYLEWGVNPSTVFNIRVRDAVTNEYLRFTGVAPEYKYRSHSSGSGDLLEISAGKSIIIKNLPDDGIYFIEEIKGENYSASYENHGRVEITDRGNSTTTITNTYEAGKGVLIINKKLTGGYEDWGVDNGTVFHARIKDSDGNYLNLKGAKPNYEFTAAGGNGSLIAVSAGQPARIANLPYGEYTVEEIAGTRYSSSCRYENEARAAVLIQGQNSTVTITNDYEHGTDNLIISKRLAGNYESWGADYNTEYQVRIKDVTNDNYLLFDGSGSEYYCYGNSGSSDSRTGDIITIKSGQPTVITNLWINSRYLAEEVESDNYEVSYIDNNVIFTQGENKTITVVNTYLEKDGEDEDEDDPIETEDEDGGDDFPEDGGDEPTETEDGEYDPPKDGDITDGNNNQIIKEHGLPEIPASFTEDNNGGYTLIYEDGHMQYLAPVNDYFVLYDEEGIPLGVWRFDEDDLIWIYDEYPPLAGLIYPDDADTQNIEPEVSGEDVLITENQENQEEEKDNPKTDDKYLYLMLFALSLSICFSILRLRRKFYRINNTAR